MIQAFSTYSYENKEQMGDRIYQLGDSLLDNLSQTSLVMIDVLLIILTFVTIAYYMLKGK